MNLYETVSVKTSSYEPAKAEFLLGFKRAFRKELENTFKVLLVNLKIYILPLIKKNLIT